MKINRRRLFSDSVEKGSRTPRLCYSLRPAHNNATQSKALSRHYRVEVVLDKLSSTIGDESEGEHIDIAVVGENKCTIDCSKKTKTKHKEDESHKDIILPTPNVLIDDRPSSSSITTHPTDSLFIPKSEETLEDTTVPSKGRTFEEQNLINERKMQSSFNLITNALLEGIGKRATVYKEFAMMFDFFDKNRDHRPAELII
ncbi:hypothetical protein J6590_026687 [Homalodisca vitripennis]|nr:hypothetical protein J6590_026687 [Homalodisca vitripennis]